MKKIASIASAVLLSAGLFISGCKKDDTSPPVITIVGSSSVQSILNAAYTDQGATATDAEDGTVTVTPSGTVNKDLTGVYTITYTATDAAGNTTTAKRTVTVYNEAAANFSGTYSGAETDINGPYTYTHDVIVDASTTVNNRITMTRLGDFANNTVYLTVTGTTLTLPSQTVTGVGTGANACDVHDRKSDGTGAKTTTGFTLTYNDAKVAPCTGSRTGVQAVFVKK